MRDLKYYSSYLLCFIIPPIAILRVAAVPPLPNELDYEFATFREKLIVPDDPRFFKDNLPIRDSSASRTLIPSYYRIQIRPLFDSIETPAERFTTPGSVLIWVDCIGATDSITLNSKLIDVDEKSVKVISRETYKEVPVDSHSADTIKTTYSIQLKESLQPGQGYEIRIDFTSRVFLDRMNGLYLSNYTDPTTNETKYLAVTQFEPYGARQLFPGFDEPDLKSIFDVSVGRRQKYHTLSNMNLYKTEPISNLEGWYWDHYNSTVKMSTYLIAVIVSEFTSETADPALFGGKPVKIWGPEHKIANKDGVFAAKTAATVLEYYQKYFQAEYPLPKMDSVEIPHFEAGAMENFGINTYRVDYLLHNSVEATEAMRYRIATVISHELAHQWFGDLVTTKTWPHLWLNEGFASYVEVLGTDAACPEFKTWDLFLPATLQVAFEFDQGPNSHPLVDESYDSGRFDKITYQKGSSLIRMMRGFLGEETLIAGLRSYLQKYSFGNALQQDLFEALQESAQNSGTFANLNTTVREIMETWTLQKGYPLVRVSVTDSNELYITQEPFMAGSPKLMETGKDMWWIPVNLATKQNPEMRKDKSDFWIPRTASKILKSDVDTKDWLLINPDAVGYYRVLYDDVLFNRIKAQLDSDHEILSSNKRCQLIDDYFNFAWTDYTKIEKALELTTYLGKETELSVWTTTFRHLLKTFNLFSKTPAFQGFRNYLLPKISAPLKGLGERKPGAIGAPVLLRSKLASWACALEHEDCLSYAGRMFKNWTASPARNPFPVEDRSTLLCSAVAGLDQSAWDELFEKHRVETHAGHKSLYLRALSCSKNPDTLNRLLEKSLEPDSGIRRSDVAVTIQNVFSNSVGRELAVNFVQTKHEDIVKYIGSAKPLEILLDSLSRYAHTEEDYNLFQNFATEHYALLPESTNKRINATLDAIRQNRLWQEKYYEPLKLWFENHQ